MADLPEDRIIPGPLFPNVGIDTFGHWTIITRKTRGGAANSKRWAFIFTCLTTRSVHLEVVEELSSDCGTNFVGAVDELIIDSIHVGDDSVKPFLNDNRIRWIFDALYSSHMGGVWERMIGVTRRILNSMM